MSATTDSMKKELYLLQWRIEKSGEGIEAKYSVERWITFYGFGYLHYYIN